MNRIGSSTIAEELDRLAGLEFTARAVPFSHHVDRLARAQSLMEAHGLDAIYLNAGTNLQYYTAIEWRTRERMVGAVLAADGSLDYILPAFERSAFENSVRVDGNIHCWEEHESPYRIFHKILASQGISRGTVGIDESTPFQHFCEVTNVPNNFRFTDARPVTAGCRAIKSTVEIDLIKSAMAKTLEVQESAAAILRPGIAVSEVATFINRAHHAVGATAGSYFCSVLFGEATAYPHGVPNPPNLALNDAVLIDTGCVSHGYHSDITRSYVFGKPSERQREVWNHEKSAQQVAFEAAQLGNTCSSVDEAARRCLEGFGYGPDYALPGLPHRTGHGIGLDLHEWPYLVRGDDTVLEIGMTFSDEPMICLDNEFGVRLEDHFYMTEEGPRWFTHPSESIDNPFG